MHAAFRRTARLAAGTLAFASLAACASLPPAGERGPRAAPLGTVPGGHIISQEDILRSGALDAFEAIERGGSHLLIRDPGAGKNASIIHRGADSFLLGSEVLLVVDGSRVSQPQRMLRSIPASSIVFIQILSGREASVQWGSEAGNGVILVKTSAR
jgi:outer membrane cobalamin receptor